jgi:hypothetical protein
MTVLKRKSQPAPGIEVAEEPQSLEGQIAYWRARIAWLQNLDHAATKAAAAAFLAGGQADDTDGKAVIRRTAELLLQGVDVLDQPEPRGTRMLALDGRVAAIRAALRDATQRLQRLFDLRTDELEAEFAPHWREHLQRVMAHIEGLLELARERQSLIDRLAKETGIRLQPIGAAEADEFVGLSSFDPGHVVVDSAAAKLIDAAKRAGVR